MAAEGWKEHVDKRGTPCGYCGAPSTQTLVLEPDEYRERILVRRGKRVGVCDAHRREPEEIPVASTFRRRRARDVQQLALDIKPTFDEMVW